MEATENLKTILADIILASSIHGIPGIIRTRKICFKFIWAISFVISASICAYMLIKSISDYFDFELVTTTTVKTEMPTVFPKITICNNNPLMTNEAIEYVDKMFNEWNIKNKDFYELYENPANKTIYTSMNLYISKMTILSHAHNSTDEFRKSLGLSIGDMLISCFFALVPCSPNDFEWYFDPFNGNCFKFKMNNNEFSKVTKEGMLNGLRLELFVGQVLSIKNLAFGNGLVIFINNQTVTPSPFDGYEIETGKQTNLHLEKLRIKKVYKPYGECTRNLNEENAFNSEILKKTLDNYKYYQQKDCLNICLQEYIIQKLNCFSTLIRYNSSNIQPCIKTNDIVTVFLLIKDFFVKIPSECIEGCPLECDSEKYTFMVSSLDYPTKVYAELIGKETVIMSRYGNRTPKYEELKESILKLNINYQELEYTLIEESQKTTWIDLISNIGGTLGLFTGFSFLSVVEFFEIIFEIWRVKGRKIFALKNDNLFISNFHLAPKNLQ